MTILNLGDAQGWGVVRCGERLQGARLLSCSSSLGISHVKIVSHF